MAMQGYEEPDYVEIDYCPFCGIKIEYKEVNKVKIKRKKEKVTIERCKTIEEKEVPFE
jgi:Zn-finger nucleic acid-binding protein